MINNATINHILERVRARGDPERERRRERERERESNGAGNTTISHSGVRARASKLWDSCRDAARTIKIRSDLFVDIAVAIPTEEEGR